MIYNLLEFAVNEVGELVADLGDAILIVCVLRVHLISFEVKFHLLYSWLLVLPGLRISRGVCLALRSSNGPLLVIQLYLDILPTLRVFSLATLIRELHFKIEFGRCMLMCGKCHLLLVFERVVVEVKLLAWIFKVVGLLRGHVWLQVILIRDAL